MPIRRIGFGFKGERHRSFLDFVMSISIDFGFHIGWHGAPPKKQQPSFRLPRGVSKPSLSLAPLIATTAAS
jgi:hypothetical protein